LSLLERLASLSFTIARVTGAVGSTLAASILSSNAHLRSLRVCLLGSNTNNKGLSGGLLGVAQVRVRLASAASLIKKIIKKSYKSITSRMFKNQIIRNKSPSVNNCEMVNHMSHEWMSHIQLLV
jgi:CO dehydrogenase nickel-insertion accessory protein CooC1